MTRNETIEEGKTERISENVPKSAGDASKSRRRSQHQQTAPSIDKLGAVLFNTGGLSQAEAARLSSNHQTDYSFSFLTLGMNTFRYWQGVTIEYERGPAPEPPGV